MIIILILVIWLPLLAFSLLNRIGMTSSPTKVQLEISVEGYPVILKLFNYYFIKFTYMFLLSHYYRFSCFIFLAIFISA